MIMSALIGETFIQSELEARRDRAMQQYHRHPRRRTKRHPRWPFATHNRAAGLPGDRRPAVS